MDPLFYDLIEPAVIFATLLGTAFGVKLLVWGQGPIKKSRQLEGDESLKQRVAQMEERWSQWSELVAQQADQLADMEERLDFTERMLTRQKAEEQKILEGPPDSPSS